MTEATATPTVVQTIELTAKEVGVQLHMSDKKVRKLAREGKISRSKLVNGRVAFTQKDVDTYKNLLIEEAAKADAEAKAKEAQSGIVEVGTDTEDTETGSDEADLELDEEDDEDES